MLKWLFLACDVVVRHTRLLEGGRPWCEYGEHQGTWTGTPKRQIQLSKNEVAMVVAEMSLTGMASGHRVVRSIAVSMYLCPLDSGKGPTMSTWT
ncbi:hypothetical protein ABEB36_000022 [Hypothenemus hampei]|uniref:Uncharacterized protein n=1 Tax=Hypothenemus hampei TaxID=57062 RepID=A0ABD1FBV1_HYPHA